MGGKSITDNEPIAFHLMGWLSKIFKGSNHKVSEGQYDWRCEGPTEEDDPSTAEDTWSEIEEIDRAIAISLLEEDQKGKVVIADSESQLKEDEQLARALQESLNVESPPQHVSRNDHGSGNGYGNANVNGNGNFYHPIPFPYSASFRVCAGCSTEIGHGRFLSCMGAVWHPECFRCHACNQPISDYEFSMSGNYPYHKTCYKEHYHPKCDVCKHFIPTNAAGLIEYRAHPFWSQKYCPFHEHDGTPRCCSCERMEPRDTRYIALDDGRKLCLECLDSAIMDTSQCQPLYYDIQEFYEGLNMKVEQKVPLLLVERQALNEAMDGERHGYHHMPETRGLCLSEEQTISTILRRPKIGAGNRVMDMRTEPYKLTRRCEVTAILILYGLPRLLTGSILAHEMMHAWLRLRGYRTLSQDVEEGICQVLAHMWLETQITSISSSDGASTSSGVPSSKQGIRSPFERKLGDFFKHQIESDTSPIYGNGFRAGNQAVLKYGLERTLDHIRMTGTFPY
ncbi:protein DA1-like isoform X1 [Lycium ferocissimum]|uniref:protein DA1-like isoform X1 n=1 Tax=Lycium ferocissimum TaxID=112874 RepID=UPI0028149AB6|nr:protein DA1-like isoform X1 [Lycium ferocissimum]